MAPRFWHIGSCSLFDHLNPAQLSSLESLARSRSFRRGATIYLPADASESVFLLAEGRIKLCSVTPDGKQVILGFIEPGEIFGELSLLGEAKHEDRAETVSPATVISIPAQVVRSIMEIEPKLSLRVMLLIGFRRTRVERRLKSLMFRSNRDRVIHLILDLCDEYGRVIGENVDLGIALSHQDIASLVGTSRESITIVLGELQSLGLLEIRRQHIRVLNLSRLAAMIDATPPALETLSRVDRETKVFQKASQVARSIASLESPIPFLETPVANGKSLPVFNPNGASCHPPT